MLTICCYAWGQKYPEIYIRRLAAGVKRNLKQPYQFVCVTDTKRAKIDGVRYAWIPQEDLYLTKIKGCFARLRLFDPVFQESIDAHESIVSMDLDAVVTGPLDPLFDRPEKFVVLKNINSTNPLPSNGSLWMTFAGYRPDVWSGFSIDAAGRAPFHAFPDDQAWFDHMMPDAAAYGPDCGVYGFRKKGWAMADGSPAGEKLPENARFVAFPGWRDPAKFTDTPWVKKHWRE